MKITFLSYGSVINKYDGILYPIMKFSRELIERNYKISVTVSRNQALQTNGDILIILGRQFNNNDKKDIFQYITLAYKKYSRVFWFDIVDPVGSTSLDIVAHVDKFLKKQIYSDKDKYLTNHGDLSIRPWLIKSDLSSKEKNITCEKSHLDRIQLAWNIGLVDYRLPILQLRSSYKFGHQKLTWTLPDKNRENLVSFRGQVNYSSDAINYQRNKALSLLKESDLSHIILGNRVSRHKFLKELANCKCGISPFGFGEICYRDFELIIAGALLIKPEMSHLKTFPDIFQPGKTFIPVSWNMYNFSSILLEISENYEDYIKIAETAQKNYWEVYNSSYHFIKHFEEMLK